LLNTETAAINVIVFMFTTTKHELQHVNRLTNQQFVVPRLRGAGADWKPPSNRGTGLQTPGKRSGRLDEWMTACPSIHSSLHPSIHPFIPVWSRLVRVGRLAACLLMPGLAAALVFAEDAPFVVSASLTARGPRDGKLVISYSIAEGHHLYADMMSVVVPEGVTLTKENVPAPAKKFDALSGEAREMYTESFKAEYLLKDIRKYPVRVTVNYQGCSETLCFMPESKEFFLSSGGERQRSDDRTSNIEHPTSNNGLLTTNGLREATDSLLKRTTDNGQRTKNPAPPEGGTTNSRDCAQRTSNAEHRTSNVETINPKSEIRNPKSETPWQDLAKRFTVVGSDSGYLDSKAFIAFIDRVEKAEPEADRSPVDRFLQRGAWLSVILIILGGLALNFTPCVLPMIPINIAIIGAGSQAGSRMRDFALGGVFGAGIAVTYGLLGLAVVLTGSRFGALNSSPWFNFAIAAVFVVLALAMFDVLMIDFTKHQQSIVSSGVRKGTFLAAFFMGCVMALLAGACVAPVVIYVLLLSTSFYAKGNVVALFLPFLLGIGMGLPWPLAGAGLSFLPKPGMWMTRVKHGFGVLILLFALYYGYTGLSLLRRPAAAHAEKGWSTSLPAALAQAHREKKPLFIDFWATWCKSCVTMDKTTFKAAAVVKKLEPYVKLKYQAEQPDKPPAKQALEHFGVIGLPTYIILQPNE